MPLKFKTPRDVVVSLFSVALLCLGAILPYQAPAQGVLIEIDSARVLPRVPFHRHLRSGSGIETRDVTQYSVQSLNVDADVSDSVAKVTVTQTFKNEGTTTIEATFLFPLPYDGAIDSMTLLVDGKEFPAKLLDAKEARSVYESIVRKKRDPALLECVGSGMFQTSAFPIPAGETRSVTIEYSQILRTSDGLTEFFFPLNCAKYTSKPIEKTKFRVAISGETELKNVYSPTYDVQIERNGQKAAVVQYETQDRALANDFRLFFDQSSDELTAKLLSYRPNASEDGYFLMLASPKIAESQDQALPKTLILALDVSGSMTGEKIEQARESLKFVLERLHDGDKFNIVTFNSKVQLYKEELTVSTAESRADAIAFANSVRASGSTNIEDALKTSFAQFDKDDSSNAKYFVFLSDGDATVNECNDIKLAEIGRNANKAKARVCTFGVGFDVDSRLLDRLVSDGRGRGEYVKPNENIETYVAKLYSHIESPVMTDVAFNFALKNHPDEKFLTNLVYPSDAIDVFAGEQIVILGRYAKSGDAAIEAKGKLGKEDAQFSFDGSLVEKSEDDSYSFIERLWAARRIGEIVDQLDLNGVNDELVKELVALATKHGILTPYTSFLADDSVALDSVRTNVSFANNNAMMLTSQNANASGFSQRVMKQQYRNMNSLDQESVAQESLVLAQSAPQRSMGGGSMSGGSMSGGRARGTAMGMGGAMAMSMNAAPARSFDNNNNNSNLAAAPADEPFVQNNAAEAIRNIGGKTFYFKNGRWIDSTIDEKTAKSQKQIDVQQFSDEYFKIVNENGQGLAQYLTFTEPVSVNYNGNVYNFKP